MPATKPNAARAAEGLPPADPAPVTHPNLADALAAFQGECPPIRKGNRATVPTKSGGQYSYDYADLSDVLEVVLPVLARHGLAFNGKPTLTKRRGFGLKYRLRHGGSGESDGGFYPLPDPRGLDPQEQGKWQTYVRRYVLCSVLGVAPGGDDNDGAVTPPIPAPKPERQQRTAPKPQTRKPAPATMPEAEKQKILDDARVAPDRDALERVYQSARAAGAPQDVLGRIASFAEAFTSTEADTAKAATA